MGGTRNPADHETEKNMKNKLMAYTDKILLRKRAVIESVKISSRTSPILIIPYIRSVTNFLVNVVSALIAYSFLPSKPSLGSLPLLGETLVF